MENTNKPVHLFSAGGIVDGVEHDVFVIEAWEPRPGSGFAMICLNMETPDERSLHMYAGIKGLAIKAAKAGAFDHIDGVKEISKNGWSNC